MSEIFIEVDGEEMSLDDFLEDNCFNHMPQEVVDYVVDAKGTDADDLLSGLEEVHWIDTKDEAIEIKELFDVPPHLQNYIDYDAIIHDFECGGDWCCVGDYWITNCNYL